MDKLDGPAEALLVDDGSKDSSYPLMLDAHDRDPRFKVIQRHNPPVVGAGTGATR